jgi:hypothetical protein
VKVLAVVSETVSIVHGPLFPSLVCTLNPSNKAPNKSEVAIVKPMVTEFGVELIRVVADGVAGTREHLIFEAEDLVPSPAAFEADIFVQKYSCDRAVFPPQRLKFVQSKVQVLTDADSDAVGLLKLVSKPVALVYKVQLTIGEPPVDPSKFQL